MRGCYSPRVPPSPVCTTSDQNKAWHITLSTPKTTGVRSMRIIPLMRRKIRTAISLWELAATSPLAVPVGRDKIARLRHN